MGKPFGLVQGMNGIHKNLDGDVIEIIFALWLLLMNREFGTVLEDLVYGDQNTNILINYHKIPPVYSCYIFSYYVVYYFQSRMELEYNSSLPILKMLSDKSSHPRLLNFEPNSYTNPDQKQVYLAVNVIFGINVMYGMMKMIFDMRRATKMIQST